MFTVETLERVLREGLVGRGTTLRTGELNGTTQAYCDTNEYPTPIVVDPFRGGYIASTVHELIHIKRRRQLGTWGRLEEALVIALEMETMALIDRDSERVKWWRAAIIEKLAKGGE